MADENAYPSYDPANLRSMAGMLKEVLKKNGQKHEDMLPAIVIAYDRASNTATVQPQIKLVSTIGQTISRPQYAKIPVFAYGGGDFVLSFPIKPGDTGWIKSNDRDISLYIQSAKEAEPNTERLHSFKDGMFFPDVMASYTITDMDDVVLQKLDGTQKIVLRANGHIYMKTGTSEIDIDPASLVTITANVVINGNVDVNGGYIKNDSVPVDKTHTHGGVQTGSGNTAVPNP